MDSGRPPSQQRPAYAVLGDTGSRSQDRPETQPEQLEFGADDAATGSPYGPVNRRSGRFLLRLVVVLLLALAAGVTATLPTVLAGSDPAGDRQSGTVPGSDPRHPKEHWYATWATSQVSAPNQVTSRFAGRTVRMTVRISLGGRALRLRLANTFGIAPVSFGDVYVGLSAAGPAVEPGTNRRVSFKGSPSVTVPAGQRVFSDPVRLPVSSGADLVVSVHLPLAATPPASWHPTARTTTYLSEFGNYTANESGSGYSMTRFSWLYLDGVDVRARALGTIVGFGDSLTDGTASTIDANCRYPDFLALRLRQEGIARSVVNAGIAGNMLLVDRASRGPGGRSRFLQDALGQTGVTDVIVLEGINDIGLNPLTTPEDLITGYRTMIGQAKARGVRIHGGTLLPYRGAGYYTEVGEHTRQVVNHWIRTSGEFNGVVDFDAALRDPANPARLWSGYDSGDHLHPSDDGYRAMADAVALSLFRP